MWVLYKIEVLGAMVSSESQFCHLMRMYQTLNMGNPQRWWWQTARALYRRLVYISIDMTT